MYFRSENTQKKKTLIIKKISLPFMSLLIFMTTITYWNNKNYGLALEYDGQEIATLSDEKVYEKAENLLRSQIAPEEKAELDKIKTRLKLTPALEEQCCEQPEVIKEKIIEKSSEVLSPGWSLYVDDKAILIGKSKEEINYALEEILEKNKRSFGSLNCKAEFENKIEIKKGLFSTEKMKPYETIKKILNSKLKKTSLYTVQEEDSIVSIAEKFNMEPSELLSFNNKTKENSINCGEKLKVLTDDNLLCIKLIQTQSEKNLIPFEIIEEEDPTLEKGKKTTLQEGIPGEETIFYQVEYKNGKETNRKEISREVTLKPICQKIKSGTKLQKYVWPVPYTKNITSPFGPRSGGYHFGIDIALNGINGKEIIASKSGVIEKVSLGNTGYGNHVVINHEDGTQTLYAHCKEVTVKKGQIVNQGEKIALVGTTGQSTGPHLHFEVRVNGIRKDPSKFL